MYTQRERERERERERNTHKQTHRHTQISHCFTRCREHDAQPHDTHIHVATHCNVLQHTASKCDTLQRTATHWITLQHTATHCNTLRHTAQIEPLDTRIQDASHCITLQQCIALQHTAVHCNTLQHTCTNRATWTHCTRLKHTATHAHAYPSMWVMSHPYMPWLIQTCHDSFPCGVPQGVMADACSAALVGAAAPAGCCARGTTWVYGLLHSPFVSIVESRHTWMSSGAYEWVVTNMSEAWHFVHENIQCFLIKICARTRVGVCVVRVDGRKYTRSWGSSINPTTLYTIL